MKKLIKSIILENLEKTANSIANRIVDKLKIVPSTRFYNTAYDMLDDFNVIMLNYLDNNWKKYFVLINPNDDDDSLEYKLKKYPKGETYNADEMESHMFYNFIDELKDEGFISVDENSEDDMIIKNIINFYFNSDFGKSLLIQVQVKQVDKEIELTINGMSSYKSVIKIVLNEYGIDSNEVLGWKIQELVFKKMVEKLESMGVQEKYGMIKFRENI